MAAVAHFGKQHIDPALRLWHETEHIGVGESDVPSSLGRFIEANGPYCFVAMDKSKLLGTILTGHDARRGYVHHLATAGSRRRQGIASMLLNASLSALQRDGITKCHALVFQSNPYASLFWSEVGWQRRDDLCVYSRRLDGDNT